jgi:N-methylhydantoinase A
VEAAATGICRIADAHMAEMLRAATVRRGLDPRDFALVAYGGGGPLHAAGLAREIGIGRVIVPPHPGMFSALGALMCEIRHDVVHSLVIAVGDATPAVLEAALETVRTEAVERLAAEGDGLDDSHAVIHRALDLRFRGQLWELTIDLDEAAPPPAGELEHAFRRLHEREYGYELPDATVELVAVRTAVTLPVWRGGVPQAAPADAGPARTEREVRDETGAARDWPVLRRVALTPGQSVDGPALVEDSGATVRVLDGQRLTCDEGLLEIRT